MSVRAEPGLIALHYLPRAQNQGLVKKRPPIYF